MNYIVDRIERDRAVLETPAGAYLLVVLSRLPADVREGNCLFEKNGFFYPDPQTEQERRSENHTLLARLIPKD